MKHPAYFGGKSSNSPVGKWVISLIPWERNSTYIEPFAGMMGVLLGRRPVRCEIVNDLDGNIVNWWSQVRDNTDELAKHIHCMPFSRQELMNAWKVLKHPSDYSPLRRALALHVILEQGIYKRMGNTKPSWRVAFKPAGGRSSQWQWHHIAELAERIRNVQIENRDALKVLERSCIEPEAVIYCDPPYSTADTTSYRERKADWARMAAILKESKARVAVSGYRDEWDNLGWMKRQKTVNLSYIHGKEVRHHERTECLWMNYEPQDSQQTIDL